MTLAELEALKTLLAQFKETYVDGDVLDLGQDTVDAVLHAQDAVAMVVEMEEIAYEDSL